MTLMEPAKNPARQLPLETHCFDASGLPVAPTFKIDHGIRRLIPPLTLAELQQLETNIRRDGCHEPLTVWTNPDGDVLVDGHNRFDICTRNCIPYQVKKLDFRDRHHLTAWIIQTKSTSSCAIRTNLKRQRRRSPGCRC